MDPQRTAGFSTAKGQAHAQQSASEKVYHVCHQTTYDCDDDSDPIQTLKVVGIFWTYEEALDAVEAHLPSVYGQEYFDEYVGEEDEDGLVCNVDAICSNGDTMRVYIEEYTLPPRPNPNTNIGDASNVVSRSAAPNPAPASASGSAPTLGPALPDKVYILLQYETEHHTDQVGRTNLASDFAYVSLYEADVVAAELWEESAGDDDDIYNEESATEPFRGSKRVLYEDVYEWSIEVKEMELLPPEEPTPPISPNIMIPASKRASTSTEAPGRYEAQDSSAKKQRIA